MFVTDDFFPFCLRLLDDKNKGKVRVGDICDMVARYNLRDDWKESDTESLVNNFNVSIKWMR